MGNTKLVSVAITLSILLIGIGYAYWTDSVSIDTTVSTGKLEVEFVESHFPVEVYDNYSNLTVERNADTLSITCRNMYPGMYLTISSEIQNTGTIPTVFDEAVVDFRGSEELEDKLLVSMLNSALYDCNDDLINESSKIYSDFPISQLESKLNELLYDVRLEPGEYVALNSHPLNKTGKSVEPYLDIYVDDRADSDIEKKTLSFDITIKWKQFNK